MERQINVNPALKYLSTGHQQLEVTKSLGLPPNKSNIIPQCPAPQHPAVPHTIPQCPHLLRLDGARSVPERILLCSWFGALFDLLQHSWNKSLWLGFPCFLLKQKKIPVVPAKETFLHLVGDVTGQKVISVPFIFISLEEANPFVLWFSFQWDGDEQPLSGCTGPFGCAAVVSML